MKPKSQNSSSELTRDQRVERLAKNLQAHPELLERVEAIMAITKADGDRLETADEIENRVIEEVRRLGNETMQNWATNAEKRVGQEFKQTNPQARVSKKKS